VSHEWHEMSVADCCTRLQNFLLITFPHIMYATSPLLIMQYAVNFNNFYIIYLFHNGGPAVRGQSAGGTDILISWVYKLTFELNQYNMAEAISLILGLIVGGFAFFQFRKTRAIKDEAHIDTVVRKNQN